MKRLITIAVLASGICAIPAFAILDTNENELSDLWEMTYNNGNLFGSIFTSAGDDDADGWTNAQEAAAGTNPFDASPPDGYLQPLITRIPAVLEDTDSDGTPDSIITPDALILTWPTIVGKQYTLMVSPDLIDWLSVDQASHIGSGLVVEYGIVLPENDKLFWRVKIEDVDTDDDGLTNAEEAKLGLDAYNPESISGLADLWVAENFTSELIGGGVAAVASDPDGDGLTNIQEQFLQTNPNVSDNPGILQEAIRNGDFSIPSIDSVGKNLNQNGSEPDWNYWEDLSEPDGQQSWKAAIGNNIEYQRFADSSNQFCELKAEPAGNDGIKQMIGTRKGVTYMLVFDCSTRDGTEASDNNIIIKVNGSEIGAVEFESPINGAWQKKVFSFQASQVITEITLAPQNPENDQTYGCYVDNVILFPVEVSWKAISGFDNVEDHIDPWTMEKNGERIFPDFKNPDDATIRHKLQLIVKTSAELAGETVYVRSFDVDDSTSSELDVGESPVIDPNGNAGDDNLPDHYITDKNGSFWDEASSSWGGNTSSGIIDENGETTFDFRVGMQPGNNYRVVASVDDESMYEGVQTSNADAPKYLGCNSEVQAGAPSSPLLTVWRRLWVENDSMSEVNETDKTKTNANFFPVTAELVVPDFDSSIPDPGQVVVTEAILNGSTFYENGFFRPDSGGVWKVKKTRFLNTQSHIVTFGVPTNVVGAAKLFDDDGRGLISPQLPRLDLVNDQMKEAFRPSFIEITDAVNYNPSKLIAFKPNEDAYPSNTILDDARDLTDTPSLWVCTLVAAYQAAEECDLDPNGNDESNRLGETNGFNGNDEFSVVYVEACREGYWSSFLSENQQTLENNQIRLEKFISAVSSHEMGHHPGTQTEEEDHAEKELMSKSMEEVSSVYPENSNFSPITVLRFRKAKRWAD